MVSLDLRILPQGQQTILLMYYDSIASESSSDGGTLLDLNIGTPTVPSNLIYAVFPPMKFSICLSLTCINCSTFIVDFLNLRLIVNFALLAMQLISGTLGGGGGGARHDALAAGVLHRLGLGGALSSHPHVAPICHEPTQSHQISHTQCHQYIANPLKNTSAQGYNQESRIRDWEEQHREGRSMRLGLEK